MDSRRFYPPPEDVPLRSRRVWWSWTGSSEPTQGRFHGWPARLRATGSIVYSCIPWAHIGRGSFDVPRTDLSLLTRSLSRRGRRSTPPGEALCHPRDRDPVSRRRTLRWAWLEIQEYTIDPRPPECLKPRWEGLLKQETD